MNIKPSDNLFNVTRNRNIPLTCTFELTRRCNLACRHCYLEHIGTENAYRELKTEEIKNILRQLFKAGTLQLAFTGGEIFLRPDILDIVSYARKLKFDLRLFTNGTLIDNNLADKLGRMGLGGIEISLYGREKTHDAVSRKRGSFKKTNEALEALKSHGVRINIKMPLMKCNIKDYRWVERFARKQGFNVKCDPIITAKNNGDISVLRYRLDEIQLRKIYKRAVSGVDNQRTPEPDPFCSAGHNLLAIGYDGTLYPCLQVPIPLGNLKEHTFSRLWSGKNTALKKYRNIELSNLKTCSACALLPTCQRCPGIALVEDGDLLGPSGIACIVAKLHNSKM